MWTFLLDAREPNLKDGKHSRERLLITGFESLYPFGRRRVGRIIDLFWSSKLFANVLELAFKIRAIDSAAERNAVAEKKTFEFVHDDERHKTLGIEAGAHLRDQIIAHCAFHTSSFFFRASSVCGLSPSRPGSRHGVIVDHSGGEGRMVLPQVIYYAFSDVWPRADATTLLTLTRVAYNPSAD